MYKHFTDMSDADWELQTEKMLKFLESATPQQLDIYAKVIIKTIYDTCTGLENMCNRVERDTTLIDDQRKCVIECSRLVIDLFRRFLDLVSSLENVDVHTMKAVSLRVQSIEERLKSILYKDTAPKAGQQEREMKEIVFRALKGRFEYDSKAWHTPEEIKEFERLTQDDCTLLSLYADETEYNDEYDNDID